MDIDKGEKAMEPKIYNLYLSRLGQFAILVPPGVLTLAGFLLLSGVLPNPRGAPILLIGIFCVIGAAWNWYFILSIPYRITVYETGEIEFISVLRKRRFLPHEIESIKPQGSQFGFFRVRTRLGKLKLVNQFDGFHEFITNLKVANPSIEIRGC